MSRLHEALQALSPRDFSSVPLDNDLNAFMQDVFAQAETIAKSVPIPPGGDDFTSSTLSRSEVNGANSATEMHASSARPPPPEEHIVELQKAWGKPLKLNQKDNPLGITMYKMAGHDRHGAWFARTCVLEGLGFSKWRKAMRGEFPTSHAVKGGPGTGSIRGIGADRRLERRVIEGTGALEVYELSAKFPAPTAPRDFITLLLTSDIAHTERSASSESEDAPKYPRPPRTYTVVSIPVDHPEAPPRDGIVRGKYESVEIIREIPLTPARSASTTDLHKKHRSESRGRPRGSTIGFAESRGPSAKGERMDRHESIEDDPELNPVEWIMVTRSDPGGGIPRFMVERSTPASVVADASKFLNWACSHEDFPSPEEDDEVAAKAAPAEDGAEESAEKAPVGGELPDATGQQGLIAAAADAVEHGVNYYAPNIVKGSLPGFFTTPADTPQKSEEQSDAESTHSSSSDMSWASAEQYATAPSIKSLRAQEPSSSTTSLHDGDSQKSGNQHDRELNKLEKKRIQLEEKISKQKQKDSEKKKQIREKESRDVEKAQSRHEREAKKREERFQREMEKLELRRQKETRKVEARLRKEADKDALSKAQRERDEAKKLVDKLQTENEMLKEQVGGLQHENTTLVAALGKTDQGQRQLLRVKEDMSASGFGSPHRRATSTAGSQRSKKSNASSGEKDATGGQA